MGPSYAGTLGSLAFVIVIFRGALHGFGIEGTIQVALLSLFGFAAIGYAVGRIADSTVRESIHRQIRQEIEQHEQEDKTTTTA